MAVSCTVKPSRGIQTHRNEVQQHIRGVDQGGLAWIGVDQGGMAWIGVDQGRLAWIGVDQGGFMHQQ